MFEFRSCLFVKRVENSTMVSEPGSMLKEIERRFDLVDSFIVDKC